MSWGPWIEHDGKGCPCVGVYIQLETDIDASSTPSWLKKINPRVFEGIIPQGAITGAWSGAPGPQVLRYRIRKPKGLSILQRIAQHPHKERIEA